MMKLFLAAAAAVSIGATLPSAVLAQAELGSPSAGPSASNGVRERLDQLGDRVDRGVRQGQLSPKEADEARRRIDDISAQASTDRERDGGRLTEADRFDILAQIDRLGGEIRWQRKEEATAAPADWSLERREQWMEARIQRAMEDGRLSGNENERGQAELGAIRNEQARLLERDGGVLSEPDSAYLANRIDELNRTLHWAGPNMAPPWS
jgi:hypothetical protein